MSTMIHSDGRKTVVDQSAFRDAEQDAFLAKVMPADAVTSVQAFRSEKVIALHLRKHTDAVYLSKMLESQGIATEGELLSAREAAVLAQIRDAGQRWALL
jgi:hypothetical protein